MGQLRIFHVRGEILIMCCIGPMAAVLNSAAVLNIPSPPLLMNISLPLTVSSRQDLRSTRNFNRSFNLESDFFLDPFLILPLLTLRLYNESHRHFTQSVKQ